MTARRKPKAEVRSAAWLPRSRAVGALLGSSRIESLLREIEWAMHAVDLEDRHKVWMALGAPVPHPPKRRKARRKK